MAHGKMKHDWDLFTPLICFVANPYLSRGKQLQYNKIHPYRKKKERNITRTITEDKFKNLLYENE
ncbi:MAG: hypothetical protein LBK06_02760 [Planctomycetaceae bacterium]|nr:hypothetical protein [Planctomycetaceae bacterium]